MLKVTELFYSLQGETSYIGLPAVFVRLSSCNLRCSYCDSKYAYNEGQYYSLKKIKNFTQDYRTKLVIITGGEPLLQPAVIPLTKDLLKGSYQVLVETNGSLPINVLPQEVIRIMDIKCPGSGMSDFMDWENIDYLTLKDEVKFVLSDRRDYDWAKEIIVNYKLQERCHILFAPVFKKLSLSILTKWILTDQLPLRLQPQLHKLIWGEVRKR
jgi:7-carboxy-7-deazaguanine synthase